MGFRFIRFVALAILLAAAFLGSSVCSAHAQSAPVISSFNATPAVLAKGKKTTLRWVVTGATRMIISPGVGVVTGISRMVAPRVTTTYILTAINSYGSSSASLTITVGNLPTITSFTSSPRGVTVGGSVTLSWVTSGATSHSINQGVGTVNGSSTTISPTKTTTYTLTVSNMFGSKTAVVQVWVGTVPIIKSFRSKLPILVRGQKTALEWSVTGFKTLKINGIDVTKRKFYNAGPATTTTYTLVAANEIGSSAAALTLQVGALPVISSFSASSPGIMPGDSTTLNWNVSGATTISIDNSVGTVSGSSQSVSPTQTTTYKLTATNLYGSKTATVKVTVGLPVISSFYANPTTAGPRVPTQLHWTATNYETLSISPTVGSVTIKPFVSVHPSETTTYTLTATNINGSSTEEVTVTYFPLAEITTRLYYTEHVLFIIPSPTQVTWSGLDSWFSVYSTSNMNNYISTLKTHFPDDYFFVNIMANNLQPARVPSVITQRSIASGVGEDSITGTNVPNICRYHIGSGTVIDGSLGVFDHEIGHNWGVFIGAEVGSGHWLANSTASGQMAASYSDDSYQTVKQIVGDPGNGFYWTAVDSLEKNETDTFSDHDLYLLGLNDAFPDLYVLDSPVYNEDNTVSYEAVSKYDQTWVEDNNGPRSPNYQTSEKKFRVGFIYVARNVTEVLQVYRQIERSVRHFVAAEEIDTSTYRFQVPFLPETQYRASIDALLADLDGNTTPGLEISSEHVTSSNRDAVISFTATDDDGDAPTVSCLPTSSNCAIVGNAVELSNLSSGAHFFTIKAEDSGGKKAFAHFVVDVD
ncbi:MAG: hypothetical protein IT292_03550 [Deltaproteobacteria bacterium]|nr:hypothetical protein [Deltaproteobacteria bacterium]